MKSIIKETDITFIIPALQAVRVTSEHQISQSRLFTLPYLGVLMLAAVTPKKYSIRIINEHIEPLIYDEVTSNIIGISVMTPVARRAYEIADEFRRRGKIVILGGIHPTSMPDEAQQHAHAVVQGEAEYTWPEVINDIESHTLKRLYPKKNSYSLATLPFPRRDLIAHNQSPIDVIQATRGCPHSCSFCSVHIFHDAVFRVRPVNQIIDELSTLKGKLVLFVDDNIVANNQWAKQLFEAMIPLKKKWVSMASLSMAYDDELLKLARMSGCLGFFIGLESINEDNLQISHKYVNIALRHDYKRVIAKMHSYGLGISAGTVYGFDYDMPSVFDTVLSFCQEVRFNMIQVAPLTPFPGTELYNQFKQEGRDLDSGWDNYDFYHIPFTPKNLTRVETMQGMDYVRRKFYSHASIMKRVLGNARQLGLYSTVVNFLINYSYRYNQKTGCKFPP